MKHPVYVAMNKRSLLMGADTAVVAVSFVAGGVVFILFSSLLWAALIGLSLFFLSQRLMRNDPKYPQVMFSWFRLHRLYDAASRDDK